MSSPGSDSGFAGWRGLVSNACRARAREEQGVTGRLKTSQMYTMSAFHWEDTMASQRKNGGRFQKGNTIGRQTRFTPGGPSPNPAGRPRGVKRWMRELRSRRYHQGELETVFRDDDAPVNQREAAMWLLLPIHEEHPLKPNDLFAVAGWKEELANWPAEDLRWLLVDPREPVDARAAAQTVLSGRDMMKPPADRLAWQHRKSMLDKMYAALWGQ